MKMKQYFFVILLICLSNGLITMNLEIPEKANLSDERILALAQKLQHDKPTAQTTLDKIKQQDTKALQAFRDQVDKMRGKPRI